MHNQLTSSIFRCNVKASIAAFFAFFLLSGLLPAQPTCIVGDDFESGSLDPAKWTASASAQGIVGVTGTWQAHSPGNCVQLGKTTDAGGEQTQRLDLRKNLSAYQNKHLLLSFWLLDVLDETNGSVANNDGDGLFFSRDGVLFKKVLDFKPGLYCDNEWGSFPPIDVDELAVKAFGTNWASSTFVIRFQQTGSNDFTASYQDGILLDDICLYVDDAATNWFKVDAAHEFFDDFNTGNLKPNSAVRWADQPAATSLLPTLTANVVELRADAANNSSYGLAMGKRCDGGGNTANCFDYHFDFAGQSQINLTFDFRDIFDETDPGTNTSDGDALFFSNDGGAHFSKAIDLKPGVYCDNIWGQLPPIDVDELATKALGTNWATANFIIRFQQVVNEDFSPSYQDGWNLDNVNVFVPKQQFFKVRLGQSLSDDFEKGHLEPWWAVRWPDQTTTVANYITTPANLVALSPLAAFDNSQYGVLVGKKGCDGGASSNAFDLYLDLAGQTQVQLSFRMYLNFDETNAGTTPDKDGDAMFFSKDGGKTFKKALALRPGIWCQNQWGQLPPIDVDELASAAFGANWATSNFVIRFQQTGNDDFDASYQDGWFLDDVSVSVPEISRQPLPFTENFESGKLPSYCSWPWANKTAPSPSTDATRLHNIVDVDPSAGRMSNFGLRLGADCDQGAAASAVDFHLDLLGAIGVKMQMDIFRNYEDFNVGGDRILFSNDGGKVFYPVMDLNLNTLPNGQWTPQWPPTGIDVDALAASNNLPFTNDFIIRIQQFGSDNFDTPYQDGIYIDNVSVTASTPTPTTEAAPSLGQLQIFPNPTSGPFTVAVTSGEPMEMLRVLDSNGQLLFTEEGLRTDSFRLDAEAFPAGVCQVLAFAGGRWLTGQVVVQ